MARRTYVLDTSVLLADPRGADRFDEHEVVLPIVVLMELEAKRNHPELGLGRPPGLRTLERLRLEHGSLTEPLPVNERGRHAAGRAQPPGPRRAARRRWRADNNDHRILAVAHNLRRRGPRRHRGHQGPAAAPEGQHRRPRCRRVPQRARRRLRAGPASSSSTVDRAVIDELFERARRRPGRGAASCPCNTGVALHAGSQSALGSGARRQARCTSCAATGRCSTCAAGRPSSASPSTCWPTRRSASSASAAAPAPARACSPSPPGSRRCSSSAATSGSWCSGPLFAVGGQDLGYLPGDRRREDVAVGGGRDRRARVDRRAAR